MSITPGFNGYTERDLCYIKVPLLHPPSESDRYFQVREARYKPAFIPGVTLAPIPSLWGRTAGVVSNPADARFLNETISRFPSKDH